MMNNDNKRHSLRKYTILYFKVTRQNSEELLGRLADISEKGLLLITSWQLPLYTTIPITIHLPANITPLPLSLEVETRWAKQDKNPSNIITGCLITSRPPEAEKVIAKMIETFGFGGNEKLSFDGIIGTS